MEPVVSGLVPKVTLVPGGKAVADKVIGLLKVPLYVAVMEVDKVDGAGQDDTTGPGLLNVNPPGVMVKFALPISKKIFPTAATLILACVVGESGTTIFSVPSLGVLATNVVKEAPPLVEIRMLTFAQLTGAPVDPFTDQVTVWVELPGQVTAVFGAVTRKGPIPPAVVTTISSDLLLPPPI